MRRLFTMVVGLSLALAILPGCPNGDGTNGDGTNGGATTGDTIRIAFVGPLSGSAAANGELMKHGAQLLIDQVNEKGGIDGKKIVGVFEDDRGDPTEAANVSRKIASDDSIVAVVGHFNSTCSITGKDEYNRKKVLQITPASTNVLVCAGSPWTFRNLYRDDYQGTFLATYAKDVLGATKAAVLYDNDDYGKGLMESFTKKAKGIGLEVLEPIPYVRERTQDFKPLVEKIKGKGCDVLFISGIYQDGATITKAARDDLGLTMPILGGDGLDSPEFLKLAGKASEGVMITTPFLFEAAKDNPKAMDFLEKFKAKYGTEPAAWAVLTYDALGMVIEAIEEVGPDRQKIRDHLAARTTKEKAFEGVTGPTWFDAEGDCFSKGAHVAVVKDGKFVAAEEQLELDLQ